MSFYWGAVAPYGGQLAHCLGVDTRHIDPNPVEAAGRGYVDPSDNVEVGATLNFASGVTDNVEVFPTTADAATDFEAAAHSRAQACAFQFWGPGLNGYLVSALGFGRGTHAGRPLVLSRHLSTVGVHVADDAYSVPYT
jgi:hypothetical protein